MSPQMQPPATPSRQRICRQQSAALATSGQSRFMGNPAASQAASRPARSAKSLATPPACATSPAESDANHHEDEEESGSPYQSVLREYYADLATRPSPATNGSGHAKPYARAASTATSGSGHNTPASELREAGAPTDGSSSVGWNARMPGEPALSSAKGQVPEGIRRYNQLMAQIERNKQLAEESWQRYVAAEQAAGRTVTDPLADRAVLVTNPDGTTTKRYLTWNEEEDRRLAHRQRLLDEESTRAEERVAHTNPGLV